MTKVMGERKFAELYASHLVWLSDKENGEPMALSEVDLSGVNMHLLDLRYASFHLCRITDASQCDLRHANFSYADLTHTNLYNSDLREANCYRANMTGAFVAVADFHGARLAGAILHGVDTRAANLIVAGQDVRGYTFYATSDEDGVMTIQAGCRYFVGMREARAHWQGRHRGTKNRYSHVDCLSLLQRLERLARAKGWKMERGENG
jgi:hypothetical protein